MRLPLCWIIGNESSGELKVTKVFSLQVLYKQTQGPFKCIVEYKYKK